MTTVLDELGGWDDDRLERLRQLRPELTGAASPGQLARSLTRVAVVRTGVLDLPADLRQVLEALVVVGAPCTVDDLALDPTALDPTVLAPTSACSSCRTPCLGSAAHHQEEMCSSTRSGSSRRRCADACPPR